MKSSLYIETTIPSYLTGRPSNNLIVAGKQEVTRQWWEKRRIHYELYISQFVLDEITQGNSEAITMRLAVLKDIKVLDSDDPTLHLTKKILGCGIIPVKAATDAAHIAIASRHGIELLMTWNCAHIANAEIFSRLNFVVGEAGFNLPTICTPDELFGENQYD